MGKAISFKNIDCRIPTIDKIILSKDQQYVLDLSMAIKSGNCKEDLAVHDPGLLSHSRWLKKASQTLRHLSEDSPTLEIQEIIVLIFK